MSYPGQQPAHPPQQGAPAYPPMQGYVPPAQVPPPGGYAPPPNQGGYPPQQQYTPPAYNGGGQQYAPVGPPGQEVMADNYGQVLAPLGGLMVRQRLRLTNLCACMDRNKFDMGTFPPNLDPSRPWDDTVFKQRRGLMMAAEHSECIDKVCCRNYRAFTLRVHAGGSQQGRELLRFERPFKCPILCCCYLPWPQEIQTFDSNTNRLLGSVKQDWRCCAACCGKTYWKVMNDVGTTTHVLERNVCCNCNCLAPSCCSEIHRIDIKDASEQDTVGGIENIFPGCTCRTLCCGRLIDNYRLHLPTNATPEEKANILAATILLDYQLFGRQANENQAGFV